MRSSSTASEVSVSSTPLTECGKKIRTIEGVASGETLHAVQQAFLDEGAFQCGYCTPGMIIATIALLEHKPDPGDGEIIDWMNTNLCRCCGYPKVLAAVKRAATSRIGKREGGEQVMITEDGQIIEPVGYDFGLTRRSFVQVLGAGLLIAATSSVTRPTATARPARWWRRSAEHGAGAARCADSPGQGWDDHRFDGEGRSRSGQLGRS